jgi:hypothetical protein
MTKYATVVIPFSHTPVWLQTCLASFKAHSNSRDVQIVVIDNSQEDRRGIDTRCITETSLGEGVRIIPQGKRLPDGRLYATHASALDYAIQFVDTPYMFITETDVTAHRDGWLDWYASRATDEGVAMVGWYWPVRRYINPTHTLLNTRILRTIELEVKNNKETVFVSGRDYHDRFEQAHWKYLIESGLFGPFCEVRGFLGNQNTPLWWLCSHDTGSWIYYRLSGQYECPRVPGEEIPILNWKELRCNPQKQYVGESDEGAYLRHHQAGTVSHDFEKHLVMVEWQSYCLEGWIKREYELWEEMVPEHIRKESLDKGYVPRFEDIRDKALRHLHIIKLGDKVRAYPFEVVDVIMGNKPEETIISQSSNAEMVGYNDITGGMIVRFDENPIGTYTSIREENGSWLADINPNSMIRRE